MIGKSAFRGIYKPEYNYNYSIQTLLLISKNRRNGFTVFYNFSFRRAPSVNNGCTDIMAGYTMNKVFLKYKASEAFQWNSDREKYINYNEVYISVHFFN